MSEITARQRLEQGRAPDVVDHPVLIPSSQGPAGGIVTAPAGSPRAALILLQGGGRSGRSGFNSEWARLARRLATLGVVVLRYDFWQEGDSSMITADRYPVGTGLVAKRAREVALLADVAEWFRERTEGLDLIVAGFCYGARVGLELAASSPGVTATVLAVPYLRRVSEDERSSWRERMLRVRRGEAAAGDEQAAPPDDLLDPAAEQAFRDALRDGPSWVLIGERDAPEVLALEEKLGDRGLQVEVEPGVALYPGNDPDIQELVGDRIAARVRELLDAAVAASAPR